MVNLHVIAIGKIKEKFMRDAMEEYVKRPPPFCRISVLELAESKVSSDPSPAEISAAIAGEGKRIISKIPSGSYVFSMCIEGEQLSSEQLAGHIAHVTLEGKSSLCFIIGGSFGLSDDVKKASDFRLSMSRMTFPHQLARVLLVEQLYRAFSINNNGKYHK